MVEHLARLTLLSVDAHPTSALIELDRAPTPALLEQMVDEFEKMGALSFNDPFGRRVFFRLERYASIIIEGLNTEEVATVNTKLAERSGS